MVNRGVSPNRISRLASPRSASMRSTLSPCRARASPRLTTMLDLPTPPLPEVTATTRGLGQVQPPVTARSWDTFPGSVISGIGFILVPAVWSYNDGHGGSVVAARRGAATWPGGHRVWEVPGPAPVRRRSPLLSGAGPEAGRPLPWRSIRPGSFPYPGHWQGFDLPRLPG